MRNCLCRLYSIGTITILMIHYCFALRNPNLPKIENLPVWPKFEPSTQLYLELNSPIAVKDRLKTAALEFWTKTIPEMTKTSDHILQDEKDEL